MAKAARKTKSKRKPKKSPKAKTRKTKVQKKIGSRKKAAKKKKATRKKTAGSAQTKKVGRKAGAPLVEFESVAATPETLAPALSNDSRIAVVGCVNSFMDTNRPGWNDDLQGDSRMMGADYHYPPPSIPVPVLSDIRTLLNKRRPQAYTFPTTPSLVASCAAGSVANMKYQIYLVTRPV